MKRTGYLDRLAAASATCDSRAGLWKIALDYYHAHDITMVSYHMVEPTLGTGRYLNIISDGFPQEWVCEYLGKRLYRVDPIPEQAEAVSQPIRWSDIHNLADTIAGSYLEALAQMRLGDGLAIPVFGPQRRDGCVALGFGRSDVDLDATEIVSLQCASQMLHLRFCALDAPMPDARPALSPREREVLEWVARGKSNAVIAQIMGLSPHTVGTMLRRVFDKLGVNDRTTAAIRGLGAGLIQVDGTE